MKETYPVRNPDIVDRVEEKEALLFNAADSNMLCVNETGVFIWKLCDGKHSEKEISKKITASYDISGDIAAKDCCSFLREMKENGFIGDKN